MEKKTVIGVLVIILVIVFTVGMNVAKASEKELVIGSVQDLSGPWSSAGKSLVAGRADYARYVNEELGGVDGAKFKVITVDTAYKIDKEISAFKKFLNVDNALAMINSHSGASYAISNMMEESGMAMPVTHVSEPTAVFRGKGSWYFGSSGPTAGDGTVSMVLWYIKNVWNKKDPPRIGLVNSDVAPGHASALYAREIFKEQGLPVAADLLIPPFPMDTRNFAMQMRKAKIDLAVGLQTNAGWTVTLRDMEKFSVSVPVLVVGILSDKEVKALGDVAVGMYKLSWTALWEDTDVPAVQLVRKLRKKWDYTEPADSNYFWGWMQGGIICEAISRAVKKAGGYDKFMADIYKARHLVRDVLENDMKGFDVMGLIPPLDYKFNDHRGYDECRMYQVQPDFTLKFLGLASAYPMAEKYKNTKWWLEAYQKGKKK